METPGRRPERPHPDRTRPAPGDFAATFDKDGCRLGIIGLNSAFLQLTDGDYRGRLALHTRQLIAVCGESPDDWAGAHQACLLLTHHPPDWLDPASRDEHLFGGIQCHDRFALHLCGHMHEASATRVAVDGAAERRSFMARSLFGLERFGDGSLDRSHGYAAGCIELAETAGILKIWPRAAWLQGHEWNLIPDPNLRPSPAPNICPR